MSKVEPVVKKSKPRLAKCTKCSRVSICREYSACCDCSKDDPSITLDVRKTSPSLKVFGQRADEIMPMEPAYIAVDKAGIRFFSTEPIFKRESLADNEGRWTTGSYEDMIAVLRYDYLEGLFDVAPYLRDGKYDFARMISPLW